MCVCARTCYADVLKINGNLVDVCQHAVSSELLLTGIIKIGIVAHTGRYHAKLIWIQA